MTTHAPARFEARSGVITGTPDTIAKKAIGKAQKTSEAELFMKQTIEASLVDGARAISLKRAKALLEMELPTNI